MKRIIARHRLLIVSIVLGTALLLVPFIAIGATSSQITFSNSGTIQIPVVSTTKLGVYGIGGSYFEDLTASQMAATYDMSQSLMAGQGGLNSDPYVIKLTQAQSQNPSYKPLIYRNVKSVWYSWTSEWNAANTNGWLLKDSSGNFVTTDGGISYVCDITNPAYQQWVADLVASEISWYPNLWKGTMLDNAVFSTAREWVSSCSATPINPNTRAPFTDAQLFTGASQMVSKIIAAIGDPSKVVLLNGIWSGYMWDYNSGYKTILNGVSGLNAVMTEGTWWDMGYQRYYSATQWKESVDMISSFQDSLLGNNPNSRLVTLDNVVDETLPPGATQTQMMTFGYASTMLAVKNDRNLIGFGFNLGKYPSVLAEAQKLESVNLGSPLNSYYQVSGTSVYAREFSGGEVLVNPTSSSYTITLSGTYTIFDGGNVSGSLTVSPYSGVILLK